MSELPPLSVEFLVVAAFAKAAERRLPGITEEALADLEDEALRAEVIRLRGPRMAPEVRDKFESAVAWVTALRLIDRGNRKSRPWYGFLTPP